MAYLMLPFESCVQAHIMKWYKHAWFKEVAGLMSRYTTCPLHSWSTKKMENNAFPSNSYFYFWLYYECIWDYHIFRRMITLVAVLFLCFVSDHRWSINWGIQSWFSPIVFCNCRLSYLTWQQREEVAKKHEGEYMSAFFLTEVIRWSYHVSFLICYHSLV